MQWPIMPCLFTIVSQSELLPEEVVANVELKPLRTMVDVLRLAAPDLGSYQSLLDSNKCTVYLHMHACLCVPLTCLAPLC